MVDTLDLDALLPEPRKLKFLNKMYEVLPVTIEQLITLAKLEKRLVDIKNEDEIKPLILEALQPIIPGLESVKFTFNQLKSLMAFVQQPVLPSENKTEKEYNPKKKIDSVEVSPTS